MSAPTFFPCTVADTNRDLAGYLPLHQTGLQLQAAKILKDIIVQQFSLYWRPANKDEPPSKTSSMESDTWQHVEHPSAAVSQPQQPLTETQMSDSSASTVRHDADVILLPTKCELSISISTDKHSGFTHVGASVKVDRVQLQLHKSQISDVLRMQDQYAVWMLRNQYAVLRPTGWRSSADNGSVTPRQGV